MSYLCRFKTLDVVLYVFFLLLPRISHDGLEVFPVEEHSRLLVQGVFRRCPQRRGLALPSRQVMGIGRVSVPILEFITVLAFLSPSSLQLVVVGYRYARAMDDHLQGVLVTLYEAFGDLGQVSLPENPVEYDMVQTSFPFASFVAHRERVD